jgi:SNF2 family DNA or RNA helicase
MNNRAFCLNSMGTGKTMSALWAYDYLKKQKLVKRVLVVCPLSTMERTWADEIFRSFPHLDATVLYGTAAKRKKLLAQKVDIYIINTDGIKTVKQELADRDDIDLIIVDELALFRNAGTDRWKVLNEIVNKQTPRRVWGMTGSPTPNEPTDAWAQCRMLTPTRQEIPKYFNRARDILMRQVTQFKWVSRETALDTVREWMQPAIRYALDDMLDLPEQVFIDRDAELTKDQQAAYKDMLTKLAAEYAGGQILAVNEAVKVGKLVQIACGVAYGQNDQEVVIPAANRLEVVQEVVEESEGKVIVFVPYTAVLESVAKHLEQSYPVAVVHGQTKKTERDEIFAAFQNHPEPRVLVANPATMSHGLTLTAATTIVWYAPIHSNETYEQACARVRRPGQKRTTVIVHVASTDTERKIYQRLKTKQHVQGILLDMFKDQNALTTT